MRESATIKTKKIWLHLIGCKLKAQEIYRKDNEAFIKIITPTNLTVDHMFVDINKISRRK